MENIGELRKIMDDFTEIKGGVEILMIALHIFETYCEDKANDEAMVIANLTRQQLLLLYGELKSRIAQLDMFIIANRRKS